MQPRSGRHRAGAGRNPAAGARAWPGVWIGAALVNLTVATSVTAAVVIATGNTLEALVGAALIRRYIGVPRRFQRGEDVFKFVAIAAGASIIGATVGTLCIAALGAITSAQVPWNWWTWWQGDWSGIVVVTPLILIWTMLPARRWTLQRKIELAAFAMAFLLASYAAFGSGMTTRLFAPLLLVLTLPLIIWAAFRFGQAEVVLTIAALSAVAVGYTTTGHGPLASSPVEASLLQLLIFVSLIAVTGLAISAVVDERRRAMDALQKSRDELESRVSERTEEFKRSEQTFRLLVEGIQDYAIFMLDPDGNVASWNAGAERIKGYQADEIIGQHFSRLLSAGGHRARMAAAGARDRRSAQGRFEDEGWRVRKDGSLFWANVVITALYDDPTASCAASPRSRAT